VAFLTESPAQGKASGEMESPDSLPAFAGCRSGQLPDLAGAQFFFSSAGRKKFLIDMKKIKTFRYLPLKDLLGK
jgi:hypothetical protein